MFEDNYTIDMLNISRLNHVNKRRHVVNWINREISVSAGLFVEIASRFLKSLGTEGDFSVIETLFLLNL